MTLLDPAQSQSTKKSSSGVVTIIQPASPWGFPNLRELWRARELIYLLAWRDVRVRYKQTLVGVSWVLLQPALTVLIFYLVLGNVAQTLAGGITSYPLFVLSGIVPWQFFSTVLTRTSQVIVSHAALITKVYFPRLALPLASILATGLDFLIGLLLLLVVILASGEPTTWKLATLPLLVILALLVAGSIALWVSALNVRYRDVGNIAPFLVQVWFFATPVAYSSSVVPAKWHDLYALNPMVGIIEGFRWCLFPAAPWPGSLLVISIATSSLLLAGGLVYFARMERKLADIV